MSNEESLMREYDIYFNRFYDELYKYEEYNKKNKDHKNLKCHDCKTKKKLIINKESRELTYSCGPLRNKDEKCGFQFSINLPEYIDFREYEKSYNKRLNGSTEYNKLSKNNLTEYDLETLSKYITLNSELKQRKDIINYASKSLKKLLEDYVKLNNLTEHIENIKELYNKRNKNSLEKKKIMKKILDNIPEEEKIVERKKYAVLIRENNDFVNMITRLRNTNINYIMIKKPKINKGKDNYLESKDIKTDTKLIDAILDTFKGNNGYISRQDYYHLITINNYKTEWNEELFLGLQNKSLKNKKLWKKELQDKNGPIIKPPIHSINPEFIELSDNWKILLLMEKDTEIDDKKYTFNEQVEILIKYYKKIDPSKREDDIRKIVNRRRPAGTADLTRIPTKPWLELCDKLETKYKIHPLRMEESDTTDPNDKDFVWPESSGWGEVVIPQTEILESVPELKLVEDDSPIHIVPFSEGGDLHYEDKEGLEEIGKQHEKDRKEYYGNRTYDPGSPLPDKEPETPKGKPSFFDDDNQNEST